MLPSTECIADLDKYNLAWWLKPDFVNAIADPKMLLTLKEFKNNQSSSYFKVVSKSEMHLVASAIDKYPNS